MPKLRLHWQILIAILLAAITGLVFEKDTVFLGIPLHAAFGFMGTMFLNALKMIIVPLVLSSIICGVATLGTGSSIGRLGLKTIGFYMVSSLFAILLGLALVNSIEPGIINGEPAHQQMNLSTSDAVGNQLAKVKDRDASDVVDVFIRMVPPNIIKAAADGQMLGLICFGLLFGYFMMRIDGGHKQTLLDFWQAIADTMMLLTMFIMKFTPIGVFGLVAGTVMETGAEIFGNIFYFFVTAALALIIHMFVTMAILLKTVARVNPINHYRAMLPQMLTAFSTASSSGSLPISMECLEKNAGVSNRIASFVMPLGATINMDGTALYECVAAIFIAQAYGLDLTFAQQFTVVTLALLTSIGVAGIPAASLVAITIILGAIGLPLEGIGLLMVTDRLLDMMRTAVNVFSDSCCAVVIAKSEGEENVLV